ncbi:hypothetical protein [Gordonia jinghuaiqii]|uniref:hypothetical protein n=1 Tax=Gordonia jinghuaiqii TaxID=2758710 RepID=UPI001FD1CD0D|nr:hypothetical protein [Gordonia jinghuaiqii]
MTTLHDAVAAELEVALPGRLHRSGSSGYRDTLSRIFFPDAARRSPPCVVHPRDGRVEVQGGATVGAVLGALADPDLPDSALSDSGRVIAVGIVGLAGFGLATRGGVGYLTRSVGLTLDHLVEIELVLPDGEVVRLDEDSTGTGAELWWAVRGCAPSFGVVTSAVLRTVAHGPVLVDRLRLLRDHIDPGRVLAVHPF